MRRAVLMTRQAISPRLAIRILRNIARRRIRKSPVAGLDPAIHVLSGCAAWSCKTWMPGSSPGKGWLRKPGRVRPSRTRRAVTARLQRDVVVFLPRVLELLAAQHGEGAAQALARRRR